MKTCHADLHIHTILSPCGDLGMSPEVIIRRAREERLDIIGITDHNSTRQCKTVMQLGLNQGILVLGGAEITSKEEVHCLALFGETTSLNKFQEILDASLPDIANDTGKFGYQVVVDSNNNITFTEERLLTSALSLGIDHLREIVATLGGLFIPAHIDRSRFGLLSQLGFIPPDLNPDALEVSARSTTEKFLILHPELRQYRLITASDAHYPNQIGSVFTEMTLEDISFRSVKDWLQKPQVEMEIKNSSRTDKS